MGIFNGSNKDIYQRISPSELLMGGWICINGFSYGNFYWEEGYLSTDFPRGTFNGREDIYQQFILWELLMGGRIYINSFPMGTFNWRKDIYQRFSPWELLIGGRIFIDDFSHRNF